MTTTHLSKAIEVVIGHKFQTCCGPRVTVDLGPEAVYRGVKTS